MPYQAAEHKADRVELPRAPNLPQQHRIPAVEAGKYLLHLLHEVALTKEGASESTWSLRESGRPVLSGDAYFNATRACDLHLPKRVHRAVPSDGEASFLQESIT